MKRRKQRRRWHRRERTGRRSSVRRHAHPVRRRSFGWRRRQQRWGAHHEDGRMIRSGCGARKSGRVKELRRRTWKRSVNAHRSRRRRHQRRKRSGHSQFVDRSRPPHLHGTVHGRMVSRIRRHGNGNMRVRKAGSVDRTRLTVPCVGRKHRDHTNTVDSAQNGRIERRVQGTHQRHRLHGTQRSASSRSALVPSTIYAKRSR